MNRLQNLVSTIIALILLLPSLSAMAQDTPPDGTPVIKLKILDEKIGKKIYLDVKGAKENTPIWIDWGNVVSDNAPYYQATIGTEKELKIKETAMGSTIAIYGEIPFLNCTMNGISDLDLSGTSLLKELICDKNYKLKSLDLQGNTEIERLKCTGCIELESLNLDQCKKLTYLHCGGTALESLDLSPQTKLLELWSIGSNKLKSVNLSKCSELSIAWLEKCALTSLDLRENSKISEVSVAYNPDFATLMMGKTDLSKLDLRQCKIEVCALDDIFRKLPNLETEVIRNIYIQGNPSADKAKTSIAKERGWTCDVQGDGTGCQSENRPPEGTPRLGLSVKDNAYIFFDLRTQKPETVWIELEPGVFTTLEAKETFPGKARYKVKGSSVNIYGHLIGFDCGDSEAITSIDLSQMPDLVELFTFKNSLSKLDLTNLKDLEWLYCEGNNLSSLDLSGNPKLQILVCKNNQLKTLNLSHNPLVNFVATQDNKLEACELNRFFETLPTVKEEEGLLQIKSNPGAETSKPQLLNEKNWKIDVLGDATGCKSDIIDAIGDVEAHKGLGIFPNPANEYTERPSPMLWCCFLMLKGAWWHAPVATQKEKLASTLDT